MHEGKNSPLETDLPEILGSQPLLHLLPKQELTPLISYSHISLSQPDLTHYLPHASQTLLNAAVEKFCNEYEEYDEEVSHFVSEIQKIEDSDLDSIEFKKPAISTELERTIEPDISQFYRKLFENNEKVRREFLVSSAVVPNVDTFDVNIREIPDPSDIENLKDHLKFYKEKSEQLSSVVPQKRSIILRNKCVPRKIAPVLFSHLSDSRITRIYSIIEAHHMVHNEFDLVLSDDFSPPNSALMVDLSRNLISVLKSSAIDVLDISALLRIQSFCLKVVSNTQVIADSSIDHLRCSLHACLILLHILSGRIEDRRLYMESYLDKTVIFLSSLVTEVVRSRRYVPLLSQFADCIKTLTLQVDLNLKNEVFLGQVETLVFSLIFYQTSSDGLDDLCNCMISLLIQIFRNAPSQREYILNELLMKLKELSTEKVLFNQQRLSNGSSVLIFAVLLVKFTEAFKAVQLPPTAKSYLSHLSSQNSDGELFQQRIIVLNGITSANDELNSLLNVTAEFILDQIQDSSTNMKATFSNLLDELFIMSQLPDWPGATVLISFIVQKFQSDFQESTLPKVIEPYILDILSRFGLLAQRQSIKCPDVTLLDHSVTEDQLLEVHSLHLNFISAVTKAPKDSIIYGKCEFYILRSLFFFTNLLNDIKVHQSFSIFYQIDAEPNATSTPVTEKLQVIIDIYLNALYNGVMIPGTTNDDFEENLKTLHENLIFSQFFAKPYNQFLYILGLGLQSQKAKLAAKSIRILSQLIDHTPHLLLASNISKSISTVLHDGTPLSRDAVIELIGKYMFTTPELLNKYYLVVGSHSGDSSVLIRKRVMRLMRRLYIENSSHELRTYASLKVLKRTDDVELGVVEMANTTLQDLWFENHNYQDLTNIFCNLASNDSYVRHLFQDFVRYLFAKKDIKKYFECFQDIASRAFCSILLAIDSKVTSEIIAKFKLVSALAEIDGHLVSQADMLSLSPYLSSAESNAQSLNYFILKILKLVLPSCRTLRSDFANSTITVVLSKLTRLGVQELEEAVAVINYLTFFLKCSDKVLKAAISSLKLLFLSLQNIPETQDKQWSHKVVRLINLVGCFGALCDFENSREIFCNHQLSPADSESVTGMIARNLLSICQKNLNYNVKEAAFSSMLFIARTHPALFSLETFLKILDEEVAKGSDAVKLTIVNGIMKFLFIQDETSKQRAGTQIMSTKDFEFNAVLFHDSTPRSLSEEICSTLVQRYLPAVQKLSLSLPNADSPVLFLQLALKLGLANPKLCVPTIIALEASCVKRIRKIATILHTDLFQKHESLADRNYAEAFKLAVPFVKMQTNGNMHLEPHFLSHVYRVINSTYTSKKMFVQALVKLFEFDLDKKNLEETSNIRDEAIYLAINLLHINYSSMEEICLILFHLDRTVLSDGLDLHDMITNTIGSNNPEGMIVENLQRLFLLCQLMLAFIQLRHVLATTYNVRPIVMQAFQPDKAEIDLRQQPRIFKQIDFPIGNLDLDINLSVPVKFGALFTRFVQAINNYVV